MKVDKHISELLYDHDCVIVPELGGFVANYAPAKIHPVQHTFTPPSKNIVFNKNLRNNDGLLANHIAVSENTTYPEALRHISHFVKSTGNELREGRKVQIDDVGTLYYDVERNIQFEPGTVNFLKDAFGLSSFASPAIRRDKLVRKAEKELKDREPVPAQRRKINVRKYVALAIAAPLIFGMVWIPLKTDLLRNVNYADLNPFATSATPVYKPTAETAGVRELTATDFERNILPADDTARYVQLQLSGSEKPVTADMQASAEPVKADSTKVDVQADLALDVNYHVVAGCFQIRSNAENFVETLRAQNISASIIGQNNKGLFVVSCGDYRSRKEALSDLDSLRKLQPNAWLYRD